MHSYSNMVYPLKIISGEYINVELDPKLSLAALGTGIGDCAAALIVPGSPLSSHQYIPCDTKLPYICEYIYVFSLILNKNS